MTAGTRRSGRRAAPTLADQHRQWLGPVDTDGPFLAVPSLKANWPQGIPRLADDKVEALQVARLDFDPEYDAWDGARDTDPEASVAATIAYRPARDTLVRLVLESVLGWGAKVSWDATPDVGSGTAQPELPVARPHRGEPYGPSAALVHGEAVGALVLLVDPVRQSMRDPEPGDPDRLSPIDRMELLLRAHASPTSIGLVTDGRWWALVSAPSEASTASGIFDLLSFGQETPTRDAFAAVLSRRVLIGGDPGRRLPSLFADSVLAAEVLTVALGSQVRRAVELLVSAFGEAAEHPAGSDVHPTDRTEPIVPSDGDEIYRAAVTVLMRVVFLLFAQEKGLLPEGRLFEAGYGLATVLDELDDRARGEGEEAMAATSLTWHRLLAISRAVHGGASIEDVRMTAYGGSLFDPNRFPFLTATSQDGVLRLVVDDRVMLHVLRAVQIAAPKGQDARRVSFREIDVEQIGYIYEGLLGYTARIATEVIVGLIGTPGREPKVPLSVLEDLAGRGAGPTATAVRAWVQADQPGSEPATQAGLAKALDASTTGPDADRALLTVTRSPGLAQRLRPWLGVIRRDLRHRPFVVQPGGLYVVETPSRRNSGAHYTPKDLAYKVVERALKPLLYQPGPHTEPDPAKWVPISWDRILDLRVADIACGSGAFLVAAARYLASHLVEAWLRDGSAPAPSRNLELHAIRTVVAQCLFGADINEMAVEMCKLSLWLVSLDPHKAFSFVDDKVLHGNSLLGLTSVEQLTAMHIDPAAVPQLGLFELTRDNVVADRLELQAVLDRVRNRRRRLATEVDDDDPQRSTKTKMRLQQDNHRDLTQLTRAADGVIAAGLRMGGKPGKALNESYESMRQASGRAYPKSGVGNSALLDEIVDEGLTPTVPTDEPLWKPLHWVLEVPDVMDRGGFDAVIGNPPFLGGQKLTGALGTNVRDWFVNVLAEETRGSADLVAYFFLRAFSLLNPTGTLGLVATNTLAQGDTRQVGLDRLEAGGFTITSAIQSRPWPADSANLEYAAVWGTRAQVADTVDRDADGVSAHRISTLLEPAGRATGNPERLGENAGISFQGCIVLGKGFVLDPDEAQQWIEADPRNDQVLFPYLNGEDLNSRPDCSPSRWVIDYTGWCELCAARLDLPFRHIESLVKPERMRNNRKVYRETWWQFAELRPRMRRAIARLSELLVITLHSKTVLPMRVPAGQAFSHALGVFATDSYGDQAVLSSSLHQLWAIKYGSGLRADPRYTPSDVFGTFPRPKGHAADRLHEIGTTLDTERREIMLRRQLGLTKLYNLFNDPELPDQLDSDVARLRGIHVELDHAVMDAYGWSDVPLEHGFHTYRQMTRWTVSPAARVEILDRLLEENHRRADEQDAAPAVTEADDTEDEQ